MSEEILLLNYSNYIRNRSAGKECRLPCVCALFARYTIQQLAATSMAENASPVPGKCTGISV